MTQLKLHGVGTSRDAAEGEQRIPGQNVYNVFGGLGSSAHCTVKSVVDNSLKKHFPE